MQFGSLKSRPVASAECEKKKTKKEKKSQLGKSLRGLLSLQLQEGQREEKESKSAKEPKKRFNQIFFIFFHLCNLWIRRRERDSATTSRKFSQGLPFVASTQFQPVISPTSLGQAARDKESSICSSEEE